MTPLQFEQRYSKDWDDLDRVLAGAIGHDATAPTLPRLYRRACEHLALARARAYPVYLVERLERLTDEAHRLTYQRREFELSAVRQFATRGLPAAVRAHGRYVLVAALTFVLPTLILGAVIFARPDLIRSVVSADTALQFEEMYSPDSVAIGRTRDASTDWTMFAFYIRNNIGASLQCFAGGFFAGVGSLFFLAYNGAFAGALGGYLTARGLGSTFYAFVVTHSAFELTALVLSGAAGLRLGHALIAPGRRRRRAALVQAARDVMPIIYGVAALLVVAAAVEAFWSSARWIPSSVKYAAAAICWTAVTFYFLRQGRHDH